MKRKLFLVAIPMVLSSLTACGNKSTNVALSYEGDDSQLGFAVSKIEDAVSSIGGKVASKGVYAVKFNEVDSSIGSQSYKIEVANKVISVTGGDKTGTMYGGLDVAEQIEMGNIASISNKTVTPDMEYRGLKFNAPLDMRTPSYTDAGYSGQTNIETMWDLDFWKQEFDNMALHRYNALSLWNLNPFPSMVKLADYPEVALDDVWKTTIEFDDTYKLNATDIVREEQWSNYEVIKKITIDEKIEHWKNVMAAAHDRGIKFYIYTWNIYTFGEHDKYGVDCDQDNETTKDYFKKSVQALIETYPDLDGLGFGAGENMKTVTSGTDSSGGSSMGSGRGDEENENWLHDTYGQGVKDALAKDPDRDFEVIHRMHYADGKSLQTIWGDLPCKFNLSDKYSIAHMYASDKPEYVNEALEGLNTETNQKLWLELRNDDIYKLRYGGTSFARSLVTNMPVGKGIKGFLMGSDGYIQGREYDSAIESLKGQMYIEKHWYNYMLFGRLAYQNDLSDDFFKAKLKAHLKDVDPKVVETLYTSMDAAGNVIPNVNMLYFSAGDDWYPEGSWTHPQNFGYITMKRLMTAKVAHPYGNVLSIPEYVTALKNGDEITTRTPVDIIKNLNDAGDAILANVDTLESVSNMSSDYEQLMLDQIAFANLGKYYANKFNASLALRMYNDLSDDSKKDEAIAYQKAALEYWKAYAEDMSARYNDKRQLSRAGGYSFSAVTTQVEKDISVIEKWNRRTL